ncbi:aminotransferase class V-fold PLP-dependent enzyme, partial [Corynebacterium propinquum]
MVRIGFAELVALLHRVFVLHGTSPQVAATLARNCAGAERDGAHSHGIFRIPGYVSTLASGWVNGKAEPVVTDVASGFVRVDAGNGFAQPALEAARPLLVEKARQAAGQLLNAPASSIAFASSGSTAWSMAFQALGAWQPGDRILVGRQAWGGNLASMDLAVQAGARVEVIPCDESGAVCPIALESMIDANVKLIDLTWLPANGGLINPAQAIGAVARRHGIPYLIDAGQAVGQLPVDVQALHCDVLKSAGRKHLRGPRGTA